MEIKVISPNAIVIRGLTSDCWYVQGFGLKACEKCEYKDTEECGGGESLERLLKEKENE